MSDDDTVNHFLPPYPDISSLSPIPLPVYDDTPVAFPHYTSLPANLNTARRQWAALLPSIVATTPKLLMSVVRDQAIVELRNGADNDNADDLVERVVADRAAVLETIVSVARVFLVRKGDGGMGGVHPGDILWNRRLLVELFADHDEEFYSATRVLLSRVWDETCGLSLPDAFM